MFKRDYVILLSFLLLILSSGCAPECTAEEIASFQVNLLAPADASTLDYDNPPVFDWTHEESCVPSQYIISFHWDGGYNDETWVDGDSSKFSRSSPFLPGTQYEWNVQPVHVYEITDGGDTVQGHGFVYGPLSDAWTFTTNGMCSSASELEQPVLTEPQYGEWLGEAQGPGPAKVQINWSYTGECYPDSFHYVVAADPEFTNIITSGVTDWNQYSANIEVPRCARIYWRVQARAGNDSGEYSETSRFTYASISSCFQNQSSIDASLIKGYVFEDYCKSTKPYVPEGVDIWPPCTFDEYGVHADGLRARAAGENETTGEEFPAELGIPGVVVDLGAGPCPSTGLDQFTTVENGNYYFMVQSPGEYCVSIDKAKNPALDHGIWTLPLTDQDITEATISFSPSDDLLMQFFGWDKNDFIKIKFFVDLLSVCRAGPRIDYREVAYVNPGDAIPIFARNEDATWFATIVDGKRCFISIASGAPDEDPSGLLIFPVQPEPVGPIPTVEPGSNRPAAACSTYTSQSACAAAGCNWHFTSSGPGFCTE